MEWVKIFGSDAEARQHVLEQKPRLLIVKGRRIALVLHNNEFMAVQDACSHNGQSLSKGNVNYLGEIICPWHHYRFDLKTGRATDSSCADLATYPIKLNADGFFIGL